MRRIRDAAALFLGTRHEYSLTKTIAIGLWDQFGRFGADRRAEMWSVGEAFTFQARH